MPNAHKWIQKYDTNDSIHVQFRFTSSQPENEGIYLAAYNSFDVRVKTYTPVWSTLGTYKYADVYIACSELSGFNYFKIHDMTSILAVSMPIEVGSFSSLSSLVYWNTSNDFNTVFGNFSNLSVYMVRVEGGLAPQTLTPEMEMENFTDQLLQDTQTFIQPVSVREMIFGDFNGIPYWFFEKLNWILSCDTLYINSEEMTKFSKLTIEWNDYRMGIGRISMKKKINNGLQMDDYLIGILDENGAAITNETGGILLA